MSNCEPIYVLICEQAKIGMEDEIKLGEKSGDEDVFNYHKSALENILRFLESHDRLTYSQYVKYLDISFK